MQLTFRGACTDIRYHTICCLSHFSKKLTNKYGFRTFSNNLQKNMAFALFQKTYKKIWLSHFSKGSLTFSHAHLSQSISLPPTPQRSLLSGCLSALVQLSPVPPGTPSLPFSSSLCSLELLAFLLALPVLPWLPRLLSSVALQVL